MSLGHWNRRLYVKNFVKNYGKTILYIIAGNFLVAFGVVFFILPNHILSGGVATLAIALEPFVPLSEVTIINVLTIALFFVGWIFLGKKFAISCVLSTIIYPLFISGLSMLDTTPFKSVEPMLAAIYSGLLVGVGLGLVFRVNGSTGGMDIPALILHKYSHMSQSLCVLIVDTLTILLGLYTYGINSVLTGIIAVFASSYAINWTMTLGSQSAKNVMIISEHWQEIVKYLQTDVDRGVTLLEGEGAWSKEKKPVVMCVITDRQYPKTAAELAKIDPAAFIIVSDVHEVRGNGFTYEDKAS